jgi:hypothetical protein
MTDELLVGWRLQADGHVVYSDQVLLRRQGGHSLPFEQNVFCKRLDSRELIMLLCGNNSIGQQDWRADKCSHAIGTSLNKRCFGHL